MKKIIDIISIILIIICIIGIIYSVYNIVKWKMDVSENKNIQEDINNSSIKIVEKEDEHDIDITEEDNYESDKNYIIDFKGLKEVNSDTIAYLTVNNTNISYIVVRGEDNSYYLNHNFNKKSNQAGWIYTDYRNKVDGTDKNLVIFGHNTYDGTMFGTLKDTLKKTWQNNKDNHIITLVTENETLYYQVFSTYDIVVEDYYINTEFNNIDEFKEFINTIKSRSNYNYNVEVNENDNILTLSSCVPGGKSRVVLHAKKI